LDNKKPIVASTVLFHSREYRVGKNIIRLLMMRVHPVDNTIKIEHGLGSKDHTFPWSVQCQAHCREMRASQHYSQYRPRCFFQRREQQDVMLLHAHSELPPISGTCTVMSIKESHIIGASQMSRHVALLQGHTSSGRSCEQPAHTRMQLYNQISSLCSSADFRNPPAESGAPGYSIFFYPICNLFGVDLRTGYSLMLLLFIVKKSGHI
jgi:hypothetical protein